MTKWTPMKKSKMISNLEITEMNFSNFREQKDFKTIVTLGVLIPQNTLLEI
jgi:hypothetical protein